MKIILKSFILFNFIALYSCVITEKCLKDSDCIENNFCLKEICHHKSMMPIQNRDIIGFISIIFGAALSNAGGIGGGGLYIPILILILEFYTHEAIPISKLMIFSGAVIAFILNLKLKHPSRGTVAIEYNIAILVVPMLLFGTVLGVTLNKISPSFIIIILLTFVLIINSYRIVKRTINLYNLENEDKLIKITENATSPMNFERSISDFPLRTTKEINLNSKLVRIELERDKCIFRWDKIKFLLISYLVMVFLSLIKGTDYFRSLVGIELCSKLYWIIYFSLLPISILITYFATKNVEEEIKYRLEIGYPYDKCDMVWNKTLIMKYPIYGLVAGIIAGFVGIGGGLIIGPLLIELGVNPVISTVTSNFLVLFTSSSTSLQFFLVGMMNFSYGGICTLFALLGSFIGTITIHWVLIVLKRESVLLFALSIVLIVSTITLPLFSILQILGQKKVEIEVFDFNRAC